MTDKDASHQIHRAGHILIDPWHIIDNGFIYVINNTIIRVCSGKSSSISKQLGIAGSLGNPKIIDHGPGILMPSLVNAHTHFELSALKGKVAFGRGGFNSWVRDLLKERELCGVANLRHEAKKAIDMALANGTGFAGEISTLGITKDIFADSDIGGVWFQEHLGISPHDQDNGLQAVLDRSDSKQMSVKKDSIAGHAPHTTSPVLLQLLKHKTKAANLPFSIHVAESDDETEFITTGHGKWASFLKERGIDHSSWQLPLSGLSSNKILSMPIPSRSPVQYLNDIGLLDQLTLVVHILNVDIEDIEIIAKKGSRPVLCPRSNWNLHKQLPDIPLFLKHGLKPALGTDSLASTETLNMFDEMLYIVRQFPQINPSDILAMATVNGADALGFGKMAGNLERGKMADFIYIPISASGNDIEKTVVNIILNSSTR